jgi:hypothetical protein
MKLTKEEQIKISEATKAIAEVLIKKNDEGVNAPHFSGKIDVKNENISIYFSIELKKTILK